MTTQQPNQARSGRAGDSPKGELSPKTVAIVLTAVVLVVGLGLFLLAGRTSATSGGAAQPQGSVAQMDADAKWWDAAARQSGGDFNQLSAQDQQRGEALAGDRPKAANTLYGVYRSQARASGQTVNPATALKARNLPCEELKKKYPAEYMAAWRTGGCR